MVKTEAIVHFTWMPPAIGFEWACGHPVLDDWSIKRRKTEVLASRGFPMGWAHYGREEERYQPLQDASGLFLELSAVEPKPDAVIAFANHYGPLTVGGLYVPIDSKAKWPKPPASCKLTHACLQLKSPEGEQVRTWVARWHILGAVSGDTFACWAENIRALRTLVRLWRAIDQQDSDSIAKHVRTTKDDGTQSVQVVDEEGQLGEPIHVASHVSLTAAAEHALVWAIDQRVRFTTSVGFFALDSEHSRNFAIMPRSLQDAIWLQFGLAVVGCKKFGACEVCGKPFEISPQVARTSRRLCGQKCKDRAHRQRRDKVFELAARGVGPKEIAKRVGSQLVTVKKWLAKRKG